MESKESTPEPKLEREIGQDYGVSRERVRQISEVALERMRRAAHKKSPHVAG